MLIVYTKPTCVVTYRSLDKHGIAYDIVDVTKDARVSDTCRPRW